MFLLKEFPDHKMISDFMQDFPNLDETAVFAFLRIVRLGSIYLEKLDKLLANFGITHGRWLTLVLLKRRSNKKALPSDLAREQGVTKATISGLLRQLKTEGYIERLATEHDKRMTPVFITEKGEDLLSQIMPVYYDFVTKLLKPTSKEEQKLIIKILDLLM